MSTPLAIKNAVVAKLTEPTLAALMPDGIYYDVAPGPMTRFVVVAFLAIEIDYMFGGEAFRAYTVLAKAVEKGNDQGNASTAGERIHDLLQDEIGTLAIPGYGHVRTRQVADVDETEVDDVNPDIRWQHRGGHYEVVVTPLPVTP